MFISRVRLTCNRARCSSPDNWNSSLAGPAGGARTSARPRSSGSGVVRRAGRTGSDTCSWPAAGCGPACSTPCDCGPRSCSLICSSGQTSGNEGATARTLWGCRPPRPETGFSLVIIMVRRY